jgi:N-sulfoglucosamine sulfohydrolase
MPTAFDSRRDFLLKTAAATTISGAPASAETTKPHIIYLHSHDSGRYLQPFGHAVPTQKSATACQRGSALPPSF